MCRRGAFGHRGYHGSMEPIRALAAAAAASAAGAELPGAAADASTFDGRPGVADRFGRPLRDLRISVTDRCNFRCPYCMPAEVFGRDFAFLPHDQVLTFEEIERLARLFVGLGVGKLRITGGETRLRPAPPRGIRSPSVVGRGPHRP